ncbi:MAG: Calx-beta domain-containing protein [Anaerolineae bacterium]
MSHKSFPIRFSRILILCLFAVLTFQPAFSGRALHADPLQPTADNDGLACSASPFGDKLPFLVENEIFLPATQGFSLWDLEGPDLKGLFTNPEGVDIDSSVAVNLSRNGQSQNVMARVESNGSISVDVYGSNSAGSPTLFDNWNSESDDGITTNYDYVQVVAADQSIHFGGKELYVLATSPDSFHEVFVLYNGSPSQDDVDISMSGGVNRLVNTFLFDEDVKLVAADVNGDGFDEQIVVAKHSGNDFLIQVRNVTGVMTHRFLVNTDVKNNVGALAIDTIDFDVAAGNVQGDLRDELVLSLFSNRNSRVMAFEIPLPTEPNLPDPANTAYDLIVPKIDKFPMPFVNLGDGADIDLSNLGSDPYDELLFLAGDQLTVWDMNSEGSSKAQYFNVPNHDISNTSASVAGGKMQLGGLPGVAVAFNFANSIALSYFEAEYDVNGELSLILKSAETFNQGEGGSNFSPVTFGDWDHDTVYAELSTDDTECSHVTDHPITTVAWWPAFWEKLQSDVPIESAIGKVTTSGEGNEKTQTTVSSHDISGYVGAKAELDIPFVPSISAEVKATAGANFEQSQGYGVANETVTQLAQTQKVSSDLGAEKAGLIQGATTTSNCFVYHVPAGNPDIEGALKLCQLLTSSPTSGTLFNHQEQAVPDRSRQWTNIQRDWANLALFRTASQSSTSGSHSASHALDMNMVSGSHTPAAVPYAATNSESNPWWQVDLGEMQSISDVRLWVRPILNASTNTLIYPEDIHIFVSPDPFGSKTFSQLLNDPRVTYVSHEKAGKVVNISLMRELLEDDPDPDLARVFKPIAGRYVRVQLAGSGQLALDEVQIFGDTHIDPDRYPIAVRDDSNPRVDGWHEVELYNPATGLSSWMPARGDINLNGDLRTSTGNVWKNQSWAGTAESEWEFGEEMTSETTKFTGSATSQRIGAEIDIEAGAVVAGGAYEFGSGLSSENSTSTSWGTGFSIGGTLTGIPDTFSQSIKNNCDYRTSPYSYNLIEPTDSGYSHNVMVIDYIAYPVNRGTLASCADDPTFDSDNDGIEDGADAEPYTINVPQFEFAQDEYIFLESAGLPQITVTLDELIGGPATVTVKALILSTSPFHAQIGGDQDSTFATQTLTFNSPGSQTVTLPLVNDNEFELDERLYLRLAYNSGGGTVITDQVTIVIADDDAPAIPLGQPGQSLFFSGDFVTMDKNLDIGETSHTVEMWVKVPVVGTLGLEENERPGIILGNLTSSQDLSGFDGRSSWDIISNGRPRVFWGFDNHQGAVADFFLVGQTDLRDGNWHHLAYVRDKAADTYAIYVDGEKEAEHDGAGKDMDWVTDDVLGTARLRIGSDYRVSERDASFHGEIDEIRIWSTPLNAASIRSLADINAEIDSEALGRLVTYFPFNKGSGVWAKNLATQGSGRLGVSDLFQPTWTNNIAVEPAVSLTTGEMTVSESVGNAQVEIKLARETDQPIDVMVTSSAGTASSPADFGAVSQTVTIPAGSRSQSVSVPIVADSTEEANEQFTLILTSSDATVYGNKTAEITIEDDDGDPLVVSVVGGTTLNLVNTEGSTDCATSYLLQLSKAVNQSVTVNVSIAGGTTASNGTDFSVPTTVTFGPNERVAPLPVSIFAAAAGQQKVIKLSLTSSSATVSDSTLTVNLLDGSTTSGSHTIFLPLVTR